MSVEELADRVRRLSRDELHELVQRVPGLREAVEAAERKPLAEARVAYQVETTERSPEAEMREVLTPVEWRFMSREEMAARYKNPVQWTEHPWVVQVEGYRGGRPIILGSSIPVRSIAIYYLRHGMDIDDILEGFPHLREAQVHDALSYYYDHREEIEEDIEADSVERLMKEYPPGKYELR